MSSPNHRKKRPDRLPNRNEKFSKLLRKRPRRDMAPFRVCYFRNFNLKDSGSMSPRSCLTLAPKLAPESVFAKMLRSKSEGLRRSLLTTSAPTAQERRSITKKILCHKLKRRFQNGHRRRLIRENVVERIRVFRSWSVKRSNSKLAEKGPNTPKKWTQSRGNFREALKAARKRIAPMKKAKFLKLGPNVPELVLDPEYKLQIEGEEEAKGPGEDEEFVLSFTKDVAGEDLRGRPLLAMMRKASQVRSKWTGFASK